MLFQDKHNQLLRLNDTIDVKAINTKNETLKIHLSSPFLFNIKKPKEKLVFYGKYENDVLHSSYVFGEHKDSFMLFLDE